MTKRVTGCTKVKVADAMELTVNIWHRKESRRRSIA